MFNCGLFYKMLNCVVFNQFIDLLKIITEVCEQNSHEVFNTSTGFIRYSKNNTTERIIWCANILKA